MSCFFRNSSLQYSLLAFFFLFFLLLIAVDSFRFSGVFSDEEDSFVELQDLKSDNTSWISLMLFMRDLLLMLRGLLSLRSRVPRISAAKLFCGGVLLCRERLCLLTN